MTPEQYRKEQNKQRQHRHRQRVKQHMESLVESRRQQEIEFIKQLAKKTDMPEGVLALSLNELTDKCDSAPVLNEKIEREVLFQLDLKAEDIL